jgi:tetratricopeptide (TPR) repeat protein
MNTRKGRIGLGALLRAGLAHHQIAVGEFEAKPIWHEATRASHAHQWQRAVRLYREALDRVPSFPEVWMQYAHALWKLGDNAAAEAAYRRVLEIEPGNALAYLQLGNILRLLGRAEEARIAYLRFEELDPAALQCLREELVASGQTEEAVASYWRSLTQTGAQA